MQFVAPAGEEEPAAHKEHVEEPLAVLKEPAAHSEQAAEPARANDPAAQAAHVVAPAAEKDPATQSAQAEAEAALLAALAEPAGHSVHDVDAARA